ncbi:predicted protein [Lichtheimia corymbifera JMRC:FSU:9682]|uniref:F-box domain-containing protein n=1 Tax=Lichtheimia corymbifera JMRC:FSU:9682 TaxID=1263082 RepID=A0A068SHK9_9FUNG|nr:predicted protein [Lichtheimia corymbifera JMRC:FSU:9682]
MNAAHVMPLTPASKISTFHNHTEKQRNNVKKEISKAAREFIIIHDDRARTFLNTAQLALALKEATLMQTLYPASSMGYLRAADVFQAQGHHQEAVVVCEKGLAIVPPTDPGYTKLKAYRIQFMNASDKRIDFITQLFPDIVMTYIIPLLCGNVKWNHSTGCPYLYVSRRWRQLISDCNMLEYQITLHISFPKWDQFRELIQFAMHVKELIINDHSDMKVIYDNNIGVDEGRGYLSENSIKVAFERIGRTLTHLKLDYNRGDRSWLRLGYILATCPNLEWLVMSGVDIQGPSVLSSDYKKLTSLTLYDHDRDYIPLATFTNILCHLPSLKELNLNPMVEGDISPIISEYGKGVKNFCQGLCKRFKPQSKLMSYGRSVSFNEFPRCIHGLQRICIGPLQLPATLDDAIALLNAHCEMLVEVVLFGEGRWKSQPPERNPLHGLDHLTHIHVQPVNHVMSTLAVWILDRAPNIRTLSTISECVDDNDLFYAITRLEHVQVLWVAADLTNSGSLRALIVHHMWIGYRSKLDWLRLTFGGCYASTKHPFGWLHNLGILPRLRFLGISIIELPNYAIYRDVAITIANDCPNIESLDLVYNGFHLPEGALYPLKVHPNLKELAICNPEITNHDLYGLMTSFQTLKRLILRVQLKDLTIIEMLKKHIPHVEYLGHDGTHKYLLEE